MTNEEYMDLVRKLSEKDEEDKNKNNSNISWKTFVIILLASYFIAFILMWLAIRKKERLDGVDDLQKQNLQLQKKFDSLSLVNKNITIQISGISKKVDSLKSRDEEYKKLYDENENQINQLKKKVADLSRIDTYTSDDIKKYFSNLPK